MEKVIICPNCNSEITKDNRTGTYPCANCGKIYGKRGNCDKCGNEVEMLAACGASQFFCNTCRELKSRSALDYFIKEIGEKKKD